jgi:HK97 family phage prohead protease
MKKMTILLKRDIQTDFRILKSDELMIGGYASIEIVDKQNDLITLKALNEAVKKYMENPKFRNVMTNHSNVQVGEVVESYRDKTGRLWKTEVDDVGFFVVIKLRDDIEKAKEINRGIRKGSLRSFSIGGQAIQKVKKSHPELGQYNEISKLELHEVTICEKGINPEAKFDILKQEKTKVNKMTKLEKALEELDSLMNEVNALRKEEEEMMEIKPEKEAMAMNDEDDDTKESMMTERMLEEKDREAKALLSTLDGAGVEIGEPADRIVIDNGKPRASDMPVVKAFENDELETLDLSLGNIEKAYEAFRQEQLEKLAYDNLQKQFEARFNAETTTREDILAKSQYDAASEIASLKQEFTQLRKSLTAEKETILKAQEEAQIKLPSLDEIAELDWNDIHKMAGGY